MNIKTSFTSLRQTTERIVDLVSKATGVDKADINVRTTINNDLGVDGDDWTDLQTALKEKESVVLYGLNFNDYFSDEAQLADPTGAIVTLIEFILYVVSFEWTKKKFIDFCEPIESGREVLTIGDLIASKYEGRFVKRKDRTFLLT